MEVEKDTTYNGWANRDTWCFVLWASSEEAMYASVLEWGKRRRWTARRVQMWANDWFGARFPDGMRRRYIKWGDVAAAFREMCDG